MTDWPTNAAGLPIDPLTGLEWWRLNMWLIFALSGWSEYQAGRRMVELIPIINWLMPQHGAGNA